MVQKLRMAVAHGAVGMILINDPTLERIYPFKQRVRDLVTPSLRWLDSDGTPHNHFPQLGGTALLSMEATKQLFEGAPYSVEQIYAAAERGSVSGARRARRRGSMRNGYGRPCQRALQMSRRSPQRSRRRAIRPAP